MSSHLNDINLAFLDASDTIIEIVTYDSTTIHNTVAIADTFRSIGYPASKVRYLVNRADSPGGIDPADLERALGRVPEHRVVSDGHARRPRRTTRASRSCWPARTRRSARTSLRVASELLDAGKVFAGGRAVLSGHVRIRVPSESSTPAWAV